jgi:hypothetical protein
MNKETELGVALTKCFYCLNDDKIVMNTRLTESMKDRVEDCHGKVIDMEPCTKCVNMMEQGYIIIGMSDDISAPNWHKPPAGSKSWIPNPARDGSFTVVTKQWLDQIRQDIASEEDMDFKSREFHMRWLNQLEENRWGFMDLEAMERLGLRDAEVSTYAAKDLGYEQEKD